VTAWSGHLATRARAYWAPLVEAGEAHCRRCGHLITPNPNARDRGWHVGHVIDRALGGTDTLDNTWPEHSRCNLSAGGKLGVALTARRRTDTPTRTMPPERERRIRSYP
jgi:hypothetical protein